MAFITYSCSLSQTPYETTKSLKFCSLLSRKSVNFVQDLYTIEKKKQNHTYTYSTTTYKSRRYLSDMYTCTVVFKKIRIFSIFQACLVLGWLLFAYSLLPAFYSTYSRLCLNGLLMRFNSSLKRTFIIWVCTKYIKIRNSSFFYFSLKTWGFHSLPLFLNREIFLVMWVVFFFRSSINVFFLCRNIIDVFYKIAFSLVCRRTWLPYRSFVQRRQVYFLFFNNFCYVKS